MLKELDMNVVILVCLMNFGTTIKVSAGLHSVCCADRCTIVARGTQHHIVEVYHRKEEEVRAGQCAFLECWYCVGTGPYDSLKPLYCSLLLCTISGRGNFK